MFPSSTFLRFQSSTHRDRAFSLLELLTVMAVISLMVGLTIPAISSISRGRNLDIGGDLVASLAQQARQNSLARNSLTALVLATDASKADYGKRIFCLMELPSGASQWSPLTPWQILPEGVAADPGASGRFLNSPTVAPVLTFPPFRGGAVTAAAYQIFSPDGSLLVGNNGWPNAVPAIRLVQAIVGPGGELQSTAPGGDSEANYCEIRLNLLTGLSRIDRP